ncbi:MAG: hypothetical protein ACRDYW_01345 [Acidimicrobiales bacterium]
MPEPTENRPLAQRHLLPRSPSDRVVHGLLGIGLAVALLLDVDPIYGLVPGAVAATVQKAGGHVRAWRSAGVERAFVMESTAISFYLLVLAVLVAAALQGAGVDVSIGWLLLAALLIDTTVRQVRSARYA